MRNNLYVEIRLKWNFSIGWRIFGVQVWGVCQRQKKMRIQELHLASLLGFIDDDPIHHLTKNDEWVHFF
jgi:hypothetical protein